MDVSSLLKNVGMQKGNQLQFGVICVDTSGQKLHRVPMKTNDTDTVYDATMECFKALGKSLMIYSDDEGALNSKKVQVFLQRRRHNT